MLLQPCLTTAVQVWCVHSYPVISVAQLGGQPEHLLVRHKEKLVSLPHNASFTLAHSDSSHVLVLVNDRHPEG